MARLPYLDKADLLPEHQDLLARNLNLYRVLAHSPRAARSLNTLARFIRDGSRLDYGTQLDRKTAIKALRGLEAKGVIVAQRNYSDARGFEATSYGLRFRGQAPTRTLGEKVPQGGDGGGENFPQGQGGAFPEAPGEDFPQPGGALPPALVVHSVYRRASQAVT